jgi:hypothetical protein
MKAIVNGDRLECWKCRALLAKKLEPHGIDNITGETGTEFMRQQDPPRYVRRVESHANTIEIKCKERRNSSKACDAMNQISL